MEAGAVWYLRLSDPHRAANRGATDRVHLVIDAVVNDWMRQLLDSAQTPGGGPSPDGALSGLEPGADRGPLHLS